MIRAISWRGLLVPVACLVAISCVEYDPQLPDLGPLPDTSPEMLPEPAPDVDAGDADVGSDVDADAGDADVGPVMDADAGSPDFDIDDGVGCVATEAGEAVGEPCSAGLGSCRADGLWQCEGDTWRCDAEPAAGMDEACNEIDDDCDGAVDEDFDLLGDDTNCGACGNPCGDDAACFDGRCLDECTISLACEPSALCVRRAACCEMVRGELSPSDEIVEHINPDMRLFGRAVAIDGDRMVVGIRPSAVVYERVAGGIWEERTHLRGPARAPGQGNWSDYGASVAIAGDWVAIGAPTHNGGPDGLDPPPEPVIDFDGSGAVLLFRRTDDGEWLPAPQVGLRAARPVRFAAFGTALAFEGDRLFVGAPRDDAADGVQDVGAVYVFERQGDIWEQVDKLESGDNGNYRFGSAVAASGQIVAVGAPEQVFPRGGRAIGVVYVFESSGGFWNAPTIVPGDLTGVGDRFGAAVALDGAVLAVGAPEEDDTDDIPPEPGVPDPAGANESGAAYIFEPGAGGEWRRTAYIKAPNITRGAGFGRAVALRDDRLLVGADGESGDERQGYRPELYVDDSGQSGAAYVFDRDVDGWRMVTYLKRTDTRRSEYFGRAVAFDGQTIVVGAPYVDADGDQQTEGFVQTFELSDRSCLGPAPPRERMCVDEADGDGDGEVDCADADCIGEPTCRVPPTPGCLDGAQPLPGPGRYTGTTLGESDDRAPACQPDSHGEVVYTFVADQTRTWCFDSTGSAFDTVLYAVETDCAAVDAPLDCASDGPGSRMEFRAVHGRTYFVYLDGAGDESGDYVLDARHGACDVAEVCGDRLDNDDDGAVDCADDDCWGRGGCPAPPAPFCGDAQLDVDEACDDGNLDDGDGCASDCVVEAGFACAPVDFDRGVADVLPTEGDEVGADWQASGGGAVVTQSLDGQPTHYATDLPVDPGYSVALRMGVRTAEDGAVIGWTVGATARPLTDWQRPYLLFSWRQQTVDDPIYGFGGAGLRVARIDGPVTGPELNALSGPNIEVLGRAVLPGPDGWQDDTNHRVEISGGANRLRVHIDGVLAFDLVDTGVHGNLGFFALSQAQLRAELLSPRTLHVCEATHQQVVIREFDITPDLLRITTGQAVLWSNRDAVVHTVTSGEPDDGDAGSVFDSGDIAPRGTFEFTFDVPGDYRYFCGRHPDTMSGYRVVVADDPALAACQEKCFEGNQCFGMLNDQACVDDCMATPESQARGRCEADALEPAPQFPQEGRCGAELIEHCAEDG